MRIGAGVLVAVAAQEVGADGHFLGRHLVGKRTALHFAGAAEKTGADRDFFGVVDVRTRFFVVALSKSVEEDAVFFFLFGRSSPVALFTVGCGFERWGSGSARVLWIESVNIEYTG